MRLLCRSINGIRNRDFLADATAEADPRFARIVELLAELHRSDRITWAQEPNEPPSFALVLRGEGAIYAQQVGELYRLLGFAAPRDLDGVIVLPVQFGMGKAHKTAIELRTRSLHDLFSIAAASVEVPREHVQSGLVQPLPPAGVAARTIRIRGSKRRPREAMIAVRRHGWWYSIDATDARSKLTFLVLERSCRCGWPMPRSGKARPS